MDAVLSEIAAARWAKGAIAWVPVMDGVLSFTVAVRWATDAIARGER